MSQIQLLIINLAKDVERFRLANFEVSRLPTKIVRIDAINGANLSADSVKIHNPSVAACWLSHQKAYSYIIDQGLTGALIVEDDIGLKNSNAVAKWLPKFASSGFEVIQIGFITPHPIAKFELIFQNFEDTLLKIISRTERYLPKQITRSIQRLEDYRNLSSDLVPGQFLAGTHCYYISVSGAVKLMNLNVPVIIPADGFLKNAISSKLLLGARTRKSLAYQRATISTITGLANRKRR